MQKLTKLLVAAAIVLMPVAARAATGQQPPPATNRPSTPALARTEAVRPPDYVIGPEDVLGIVFWREPEMSGDATVRPDGRITIPVIGEVQAAGRQPEQLQKEITEAAAKYISSVNVVVVVRAINSRKVFVTGRVTTPGIYSLSGPMTIIQAIAVAGGLTEFANPKNITVLRNENGQARSLAFNYHDVSRGKSLEQNIQLRPGDTVVVP